MDTSVPPVVGPSLGVSLWIIGSTEVSASLPAEPGTEFEFWYACARGGACDEGAICCRAYAARFALLRPTGDGALLPTRDPGKDW